jgi:hypothetical protein
MSQRNLQKERIERAAQKLFEATRVSEGELEKIVTAPHLFDSIKRKIKTETPRKTRKFFAVWNLQTASAAFAVLLVALAAAAVIFSKINTAPLTVEAVKPVKIETPKVEQIEIPTTEPEITKTETKAPAVKNPVNAEKTDFKTETKLPARETKTVQPRASENHKQDAKAVFYPLAAGNWEANGEDLRIVRAELSRSELFALGVNLPVENESARIKTDLLVGTDGVARAFRFVE